METVFVCDLVSADKLSDFCEVWYKSVLERCSASVGFVEISSVIVIINLCVLPVFFFTDMVKFGVGSFCVMPVST